MGKNKNDIDSMDKQIEKLDNQIKKLKERESSSKGQHVIYIDRLVDDHIQRNKKKKADEKNEDTKKIASISEINEAAEEKTENTKKITKIDTKEIEKKDQVVELEIHDIKDVSTEDENEEFQIYYWIMLALAIFMIIFFIILLF